MSDEPKGSADYTSTYAPADGRRLRVPYRFRGSPVGEDELAAVRRVVETGETLTAGGEVAAFEAEFAAMAGVPHAFATSSCTAALTLAYALLGVGPGDEVIAPPLTFVATTLPALHRGAKVVFADVDPRTLNLDPEAARARITARTRAIAVVHYAGQMADMTALREVARAHGLALVEDAAHAAGASLRGVRAGAWGDAGCFSFHSLKNMTTLGEGGMLTLRDPSLAADVPALRSMGLVPFPGQSDYWLPYHYQVEAPRGVLPFNFRLGEPAAACGRVQLRKLEGFNRARRAVAARLTAGLVGEKHVVTPWVSPDGEHVFHLYTLLLAAGGAPERDAVVRRLYETHGVQPILHYLPTARFALYRERGLGDDGACPVADTSFSRLFNLPIHPGLSDADVAFMIEAVQESVATVLG